MTEAEILALPERRQCELLALACRDVLAVWDAFAAAEGPIRYRDGVVGEVHEVERDLPGDALDEIDRSLAGYPVDGEATALRFREPIVALHDDDLGLPGPARLAYHAIYNLHRNVFGHGGLAEPRVVLEQCANALGGPRDSLLRDWWIRAWDAWATQPPLAYPPSAMTRDVYDALVANDLARAASLVAPSRLAIAIAALRGRDDEAIAIARSVLGIDGTAGDWLPYYATRISADAIAAYGMQLAIICDDDLAILDRETGRVVTPLWDRRPRLVRWSREGERVWVAGDVADSIGVYGTFVVGYTLDGDRDRTSGQYDGRHVLAAVGPCGEIVPVHDELVMPLERIGGVPARPGRVIAAAFSDASELVVSDGTLLEIWSRGELVHVLPLDAPIDAIWLGGREALVHRCDGTSTVIDLGAWIRD